MRYRTIVHVRTIVVPFLLTFTALFLGGCVIGHPVTEYQTADVMPEEESRMTIGYSGIRYQTGISAQDELGVSAWSLNFPFYLFNPKFYDIGLQMNYKHRFTEGRSRHALAFIGSGSVYKAFVRDFVMAGDDAFADRYRYLGYSLSSGLLYSYRFADPSAGSDERFAVRLPHWLTTAHTLYGGAKVSVMQGGTAVFHALDASTVKEHHSDIFVLPFAGIAGGSDERRIFLELHPMVLMSTIERKYRTVMTLSGGVSFEL